MAIKYCDHGLYAENVEFIGGVNAYGNTLTVTSVTSGRICIGTHIANVDPSLPYGAIVISYGTGTGGTGTYNLHVSTSVAGFSGKSMSGTHGMPHTIPVWGVAQDGDGGAPGKALPAIAEVVFTGVPSSGTIAVCGDVLSVTWATNANTCANNLATAINDFSVSPITGPASFTNKSSRRNHVYARGPAAGAPAGTCQIMTRQGSSNHNGLIAVTHTLNNVSSPSTINFSGGVSGAWGWIYAFTPMWPASFSAMGYGVWGLNGVFCGSVSPGDVVNMRANRTVRGYTFTGDGVAFSSPMPAIGTDAAPVTYVVDDGTIWPEDGPEPVLRVHMQGQGQTRFQLLHPGAGVVVVKAKKYNDSKYGIELLITNNTLTMFSTPTVSVVNNARAILEGVCYNLKSGTLAIAGNGNMGYGVLPYAPNQHISCRYIAPIQDNFVCTGGYDQNWNPFAQKYTDTIFDCGTASSSPHTGLFNWLTSGGGVLLLQMDSCKFVNFVVGSRLFSSGTVNVSSQAFKAHFRNCDFGGITVLGPKLGGTTPYRNTQGPRGASNGIMAISSQQKQDWFIDTYQGWAAWVSTRNFPTLNARLQDGLTPWSIQIIPTQLTDNVSRLEGFETPRIVSINSLSSGVRTITVEFGLEQSLAWTKSDITLMVEYVDTTGAIRSISTYSPLGGALTPSTASWTNASGSQFTYSDSGVLYFNKYKLEITTPTAVATDTEIGAIVSIRRSVTDTTKMVFVDPSLQVV